MSLPDQNIVSVGECMVEMARGEDGRFGLAFGGDTFNTAVYLARLGAGVAYLSALGDDPYSRQILAMAADEGVDTAPVMQLAGRMPGLYLIETKDGERTFWYWRQTSPARDVFKPPNAERAAACLLQCDWIYFSGITLSLYDDDGLDRFAAAIAEAKDRGARVAMDSNYRPVGWGQDQDRARAVFARFWHLADIALPTFDDEQALWDDADPATTIHRLRAAGVGEVCVKLGADGACLQAESRVVKVPCPAPVAAVDTTAAGDSFNAAYLAARLDGLAPPAAAAAGHRLAAIVIAHRGAVIPAAAMRDFLLTA